MVVEDVDGDVLTFCGCLGGGTEVESSRSRSTGRHVSKGRRGLSKKTSATAEEEEEEEEEVVDEDAMDVSTQPRFDTAQMRRAREMEKRLEKQFIGYAYVDLLDAKVRK